jgi:hypothetical protein
VLPRVLFGALVVVLGFIGVSTLATNAFRENMRKAEAKATAVNLAAGLNAYYTEYGKWPEEMEDGEVLDSAKAVRLLNVLRAKNTNANPRKISFFDAKEVEPNALQGGFRRDGVLCDPWGRAYLISVDADGDELIPNPYAEDDDPIPARAAVWSLGKDGKQGTADNPYTHTGSDDVTSWK